MAAIVFEGVFFLLVSFMLKGGCNLLEKEQWKKYYIKKRTRCLMLRSEWRDLSLLHEFMQRNSGAVTGSPGPHFWDLSL